MAQYCERKDDRLLDVDDLAQMLGVTKGWVYERTRSEQIPSLRLGKYLRFWESEVLTWVQTQHVARDPH